jgi:hypothetical protein
VKKALLCLVLLALTLGLTNAPAARAEDKSLVDRALDRAQEKPLDTADFVVSVGKVILAVVRKDGLGAVAEGADAVIKLIRLWKGGDLNDDQQAKLHESVKLLYKKCDEIPTIRRRIAEIDNILDKKADRKELLEKFEELRFQTDKEIAKLKADVKKLDKKVDNLAKEVRKQGDRLDHVEGVVTDLTMEKVRPMRAHLLLKDGGEWEGTLAKEPGTDGVTILLEPDGKKKHFRAGLVETVTVKAGYYFWDKEKGRWAWHAHDADTDSKSGKPSRRVERPKDLSTEKKDAELLQIFENLTAAERGALRAFAERRDEAWGELRLEKKLYLLQLKILQDYREAIAKERRETRCSESQALRVIIIRLSTQKGKQATKVVLSQ